MFLSPPRSLHALQQFHARLAWGGPKRTTGEVVIYSGAQPLQIVSHYCKGKTSAELTTICANFEAVHKWMCASVRKWQVLLQHFNEFAMDPCENCISCHHYREQDIGDVLRLVHNVFEAVGDYRSRPDQGIGHPWGTWEAAVCNLLCRKQDTKTKESFPEYVHNVQTHN